MAYDADNQSFLIKSDKQGDILMSVPLEEAPALKEIIGEAADFVAVLSQEPPAGYVGNYVVMK